MDDQTIAILIVAAFCAAVLWYLRLPAVIGRAGEARVNRTLNTALNPDEYIVLPDLTLPAGGGTTQVDHVVLSPFGVFVIETKNLSGWIFGGGDQKQWTQVLRRKKYSFQNPLHQNNKHIRAVATHSGVPIDRIEGIVVFVGNAVPKTPMPPNVVWSVRSLADLIRSRRKVAMSESEVAAARASLISTALKPGRETNRRHVAHIRAKATNRQNNMACCPNCQGKLVERRNRRTGERFMGCLDYPRCKGTRPLA